MDKNAYFQISTSQNLPKRCPILAHCERRALTIAISNDRGLDINNLEKIGIIRKPIVRLSGEDPYKAGGRSSFVCGNFCPEVALFDSSSSLFSGGAITKVRWDTDENPKEKVLEYKHYSECPEYCSIQYNKQHNTCGQAITGIDLFLTHQIYSSKQHPNGWDKYVYDAENIHYALLKIIAESCYFFTQTLLGLPDAPKNVKVVTQPQGMLFDLEFIVDDISTYCEVKIWADLSNDQFNRQIDFLNKNNAQAIYILFTKSAANWSATDVSTYSEGRCRVISFQDLINALNSIGVTIPIEVAEIVAAYKKALISLSSRY